MIPILELRGGLLVAGPLLGVPVATAIPLCIIGNIIPVPFILLLITPVFKWMKGTKLFRPMVEKLEAKAMSKSDKIEKYDLSHKQTIPKVLVKDYPRIQQDKIFSQEFPTLAEMYNSPSKIERYWVNECVDKLIELHKMDLML